MHSIRLVSSKNYAAHRPDERGILAKMAFKVSPFATPLFHRLTREVKIYRRRVTAADDDSNPFAGGWLVGA